jgi:hypothetical protein
MSGSLRAHHEAEQEGCLGRTILPSVSSSILDENFARTECYFWSCLTLVSHFAGEDDKDVDRICRMPSPLLRDEAVEIASR